MVDIFSDYRDKLNSMIIAKDEFRSIADSSEFLYKVRHTSHRSDLAPTITLQAHTRAKTLNDLDDPCKLIDGGNVITCTIEIRANGMVLKRESGDAVGIGCDLPMADMDKVDPMRDLERGRDEIFMVIKHFYSIALFLFVNIGFVYQKHTITQMNNDIGSEIYRLHVQSSTRILGRSKKEFFIASKRLKPFNMVIHESNPPKETPISDYDALVEYLNSIYTQPSVKARYESENRRLDILIDSMRNN